MLYVFEELEQIDDLIYSQMLEQLSPQRIEKAERYKGINDKKQCAAVYLLLRYALMTEYGMTAEQSKADFDYIENGKPVLRDYRDIHFNMSHCIYGVACAVSCHEVGVDIQDIRPYRSAVLDRIATIEEKQAVLTAEVPDRAFCQLWSKKECISKCNGRGLAAKFSRLAVPDSLTVWENERYVLTCSEPLELVILTRTQLEAFFEFGSK